MQAKKRSEPVAVWLDAVGQPARLVFHGARFRVIDTPTPLPRHPEWPSGITHPPADVVLAPGWRVTGRSEGAELLVFDLRLEPDGWVAEAIFA
ncbi:hypothetical protein ACGGZK_11310 [Agromyces sp. MMS24-K17]|uniref:hypothetical protein n=1 Tax=Agromyces sp. MMS24-K17 TaxID=3372850 RepID=UPI00375510FB